jgi:hypothetical protein
VFRRRVRWRGTGWELSGQAAELGGEGRVEDGPAGPSGGDGVLDAAAVLVAEPGENLLVGEDGSARGVTLQSEESHGQARKALVTASSGACHVDCDAEQPPRPFRIWTDDGLVCGTPSGEGSKAVVSADVVHDHNSSWRHR